MVNNPVFTVAHPLLHLMVHQMGGQLAGRAAALHQAPADAVIFTLFINLYNGNAGLRIHNDVTEIFSGARHQEKFPCQIRYAHANWRPFAAVAHPAAGTVPHAAA